jgi:hypothetical protein
MLFERTEQEATERLKNGEAWEEFCDNLKEAGAIVLREKSPKDGLTMAEGYRYLTRITRAALQTFVENADPLAPVLQRVVHETAKMGADNPDNHYQNAAISGEHEYRIFGNRGSVHYLGFGTQIGHYGQGQGMPPTGYLEAKDMHIEEDGSFEIVLSCDKKPGNWLPMKPETGTLIVRQTFLDREHEEIAQIAIERIGASKEPSILTPKQLDYGLTATSTLVVAAAGIFTHWAEGFMEHVNELPEFDNELSSSFGGDPNIVYYHSYWKIEPDEALVIEVTPPECELWNFQLNNHWMESLDYRYFPIVINTHSAKTEPDGSIRIVVADENPGVDNWLSTAGHHFGTMCFRWVRAKEHPVPQTRVVKLRDLEV